MFETGMGIGFLLTSVLAIAVGTVIVSQNIYAATTEHFAEYGTLKAMGISNRGLAGVVVSQGLLSGLAGSVPGCLLGAAVVEAIKRRGLEATLSPDLVGITIACALATCAVAAATSVSRVWKLEPALVFRG
jgi:putative ABC transport system permease protein